MPTPADRRAAATDQYLDAKTAAVRLNLPLNAIYRLIESGKLPALRFPVRIHPDELAKVVDRCRIKPGELRHLTSTSGVRRAGLRVVPLEGRRPRIGWAISPGAASARHLIRYQYRRAPRLALPPWALSPTLSGAALAVGPRCAAPLC